MEKLFNYFYLEYEEREKFFNDLKKVKEYIGDSYYCNLKDIVCKDLVSFSDIANVMGIIKPFYLCDKMVLKEEVEAYIEIFDFIKWAVYMFAKNFDYKKIESKEFKYNEGNVIFYGYKIIKGKEQLIFFDKGKYVDSREEFDLPNVQMFQYVQVIIEKDS